MWRSLRVGKPIGKQVSCYTAGDTLVTGLAPIADSFSQLIDQLLPIVCFEIVEVEHAALRLLPNGHLRYIGREDTATITNILVIQVALSIGRVMPFRLCVRRVQDGIVGSCHGHPFEFKAAILSPHRPPVRPA